MVTETKNKNKMNLITDAVLYNVVAKKNNLDKTKAVKYYAKVKNAGLMTEDELEDQLEQMSTLTIGDVKNVVANLQAEILKAISRGNVVQFGKVGTFSIGASSKGADTAKDFNATKIKRAHVNFKAGSAMKDALAKIKFTKLGESDADGNGGSSSTGGSTSGGSTPGGSTSGGSTSGGSSDGGGPLKPNK